MTAKMNIYIVPQEKPAFSGGLSDSGTHSMPVVEQVPSDLNIINRICAFYDC